MNRIKCLDYCCKEECSEALCKEILEPAIFQKYIRFTHAFKVDTNKHLIFCPNNDCTTLIDKTQTPVRCTVCKTEACPKCDQKEHVGKRCV